MLLSTSNLVGEEILGEQVFLNALVLVVIFGIIGIAVVYIGISLYYKRMHNCDDITEKLKVSLEENDLYGATINNSDFKNHVGDFILLITSINSESISLNELISVAVYRLEGVFKLLEKSDGIEQLGNLEYFTTYLNYEHNLMLSYTLKYAENGEGEDSEIVLEDILNKVVPTLDAALTDYMLRTEGNYKTTDLN